MRVLVTGATGFVAGHLIPRLVDDGHDVIAAGHDPARLPRTQGVEPLVVDFGDASFGAALPGELDAVVHLVQANVPFPEGAGTLFAVNVASTQQLLDHARRAGVRRFILASSGSVHGAGERPWRESDPPAGPGYYAATKLAAERLVAAYAGEFRHSIFRLFTPYGPGQVRRLVPGLVEGVRSGRVVTVRPDGGPRFTPLFVTHVVDVLAQSLAAEGDQLLNLGGEEVVSIREMADTIGQLVGREPVFAPAPGGASGDTLGNSTQLREHYRLPERLVTFRDGVRRILDAPRA